MKIKSVFLLILMLPQYGFCLTPHLVPLGGNVLRVKDRSLEMMELFLRYDERVDTSAACIFFSIRSQGHATAVRLFKSDEAGYNVGVIAMPSKSEETRKIDADSVELINRLWLRELLQTRASVGDRINLDSAPVIFLGHLEGQGLIAGLLPNNPNDDCAPVIMAKVADMLIQYVRNPNDNKILSDIKAVIDSESAGQP